MLNIYTGPLSVQAQYSRFCHISISFHYDGSLVTWTVVCLTATKFKPLILSLLYCRSVPSYNPRHGPHGKHVSRVIKSACLLVRYLAMDVFYCWVLTSGMCLPSRCLAMVICFTILIYSRIRCVVAKPVTLQISFLSFILLISYRTKNVSNNSLRPKWDQ
jgi:hypothetical protein